MYCSYFSQFLDNLKRHTRKHTGGKPFFCYNCGKDALNKHSLIHAKKLHFDVPYLTKKEVFWNQTPSDPFSDSSVAYPSDEDLMSIFQKCANHPTQFAVNIARILFTREELRESNCRGKKQKSALEKRRLLFIHDAVMKFYQIPISSQADIWKQCIKRIDTRCRHERRPRIKDFATSDSFKDIFSYY